MTEWLWIGDDDTMLIFDRDPDEFDQVMLDVACFNACLPFVTDANGENDILFADASLN